MAFASDFIEAGLGNAVVIDWYSDEEFVHVVGKRQHRFEIHKDRAIEVLQVAHQRDLFSHQLKLAFSTIQEWMDLHEDLVCTCFLTLRDSHLLLIVVPTQVECSDDLEDLVSDLDLKIASDTAMDLLKLNIIVLPYASEESMKSFFDERCLMAFPHREKAKQTPVASEADHIALANKNHDALVHLLNAGGGTVHAEWIIRGHPEPCLNDRPKVGIRVYVTRFRFNDK